MTIRMPRPVWVATAMATALAMAIGVAGSIAACLGLATEGPEETEPTPRPGARATRTFGPSRDSSSEGVNRIAQAIRGGNRISIEDFSKIRMTGLSDLVRLGPGRAPAIAELLEDGDQEVRSIAAQSLGLLGNPAVAPALERAIAHDPIGQVRLHAVQALGQLGMARSSTAIRASRDADDVILVRQIADLEIARTTPSELEETRAALAAFRPEHMDSAEVGGPAPDFLLRDTQGRRHSLADHRGRTAVVLVFMVGDVCPYDPSRIEELRAYKERFEDLGATLLMIDAHESCRLDTTLAETGPAPEDDIPFLADPSYTVSAAYGVAMRGRGHIDWTNRPSSVIIDRDGIIRFLHRDSFQERTDPEILLQVVRMLGDGGGSASEGDGPGHAAEARPITDPVGAGHGTAQPTR
jgi:peroxiredoxin